MNPLTKARSREMKRHGARFDGYARAEPRQCFSGRLAEAAGGAGDERGLVGKQRWLHGGDS